MKKKLPNFFYEKRLWKKGIKVIAGVDEVGKGAFAGPVVVGCVVFPSQLPIHRCIGSNIHIDDSKKLSPKQREISDKWLKKNVLAFGIGEGSVNEINKYGVGIATKRAFRRAVINADNKLIAGKKQIEYLLLDAYYIPYMRGFPKNKSKKVIGSKRRSDHLKVLNSNYGKQLAIINGDGKSLSIAAASIIAKVYRDKLMLRLSKNTKYKEFCWDKNKGYGTKVHRNTIAKYGITKIHRLTFIKNYI